MNPEKTIPDGIDKPPLQRYFIRMAEPFKELCKLTGQAVAKYKMIAAATGFWSAFPAARTALRCCMPCTRCAARPRVEFGLIAATFDPGFPEFNLPGIAGYCRRMGWEHRMVALPVAEILEEKKFTATPCVLCSRLRRGKLYGLARELGCNKLALGQHFDDIAASFLMSLCRGQGLTTMGPNVPAKSEPGSADHPSLRPRPESLIKSCLTQWDLPAAGKCRYETELKAGDRAFFRNLVDELAERIPNLRSQMARSLGNLQPEYLLDPAYLKKS